ncbi:MAG TPA: NUDIX hydrolase [Bacillales bacterium]|nr:NUDIX hydrolase [Bacillales bacterium]
MEKWKTTRSEYLFKTPFGNLRQDSCELPDGKLIDRYYVNEYSDWVNAVVITRDRQIVLVKQYRHAAEDFFLEVPAGKIEEDETHEAGILREVREETGYVSDKEPVLLGEFFVNPATQNNKVRTYLLLDAYQAFEQDLDETEEIAVHCLPFDEMEERIQQGEINQLFTVNAYHLAQNYLTKKQEL